MFFHQSTLKTGRTRLKTSTTKKGERSTRYRRQCQQKLAMEAA
ncbi:hypothetical protein [Klebsiella pneumoniae IS43]|uniref:Uncharacterized protein n=1 Tax=Klebsiella pneumoniae IS43 TaxID=1432552 RepID=W1DWS5_KLEPN|nr:hypothetical protein [Klebsiella pneumoniae IS43]